MRLRRSWERWLRTKRLKRTARRLRRMVQQRERDLTLQQEVLTLLEQLEHPLLLASPPAPEPLPLAEVMSPELLLPPPLTEEEMQEIREHPMLDPLEEIEYRLGLSTSTPSPQTWAD